MKRKGLITVLSGFSGAGKGTIMKHLLEEYPGRYNLSISATTRNKRIGEEDGREYFFKTREEFEEMIKNDELLEYAEFSGNYYGTPKEYVNRLVDEGRDVLLEIEVNGALQVRKIFPDSVLLFVTPPSAEALKSRLVGRKTESMEEIENRLSISSKESLLMDKYDYLIVNDEVSAAVKEVHDIIECEILRTGRNSVMIEKMQRELALYKK